MLHINSSSRPNLLLLLYSSLKCRSRSSSQASSISGLHSYTVECNHKKKMRKDIEMEDLDDEFSDSKLESDSEEDEDVKLDQPSKEAIYNKDGLLEKLGDISWPENVEWIHKLSIDINQEQEVDVNDDLARELAFYTQALEGTRSAFEKLHSMGVPFLRPADYYAEMAKTDTHMERVKGRLLSEKRKMEEAEERRKARESKKMAKEIQAQKQKERAKQKKEEIESVKKWRKQRQHSGFPGGEIALPFEDGKALERSNKKRPGVSPWDRSGGKAKEEEERLSGLQVRVWWQERHEETEHSGHHKRFQRLQQSRRTWKQDKEDLIYRVCSILFDCVQF